MIVIIDNYDSFTYNLVQYVGVIDTNLEVFRNDEITIKSLSSKQISHIIISPGPGWPDDAGKTIDIINCFKNSIPILGICLGHQAIVRAFNGEIVKCNEVIHGKTSAITFKPSKLFKKVKNPFLATRYHSLCVDRMTLTQELKVIAETKNNTIMAVEHISKPIFGLQFHPESIATNQGHRIIKNFLNIKT